MNSRRLFIRGAEVDGEAPLDLRIEDGVIVSLDQELILEKDELLIDADGGALLPGLHDHHIHLYALAATERSVRCGPPQVCDAEELRAALGSAARRDDGWIRGVGYHDSIAGELNRQTLDALRADTPLRIQHRSGAMWILNSEGIVQLGLDEAADHPGIERDETGRATGRLFRADAWLRERLGERSPLDLHATSLRLASYGVTGLTDATHTNGSDALASFQRAVRAGQLLQHLWIMGRQDLPEPARRGGGAPRLHRGAVKIMLDERSLPEFEVLKECIRAAHAQERPVAIHCVTRSELVLAAAALRATSVRRDDRIEHAAVAPPDAVGLLKELDVHVITQPHFIAERGDAYLAEVDPSDLPWLYRGRGFLDGGVPLGGGTDAPFGHPDPWRAMLAAVNRRSPSGAVLSQEECLSPEQALALFTSAPETPGAAPRRVEVGARADLCLLDRPWSTAREALSSDFVRTTLRAGKVIWEREAHSARNRS